MTGSRKRKAWFSSTVDGKLWCFCWSADTNSLIGWTKHMRKRKRRMLTARQLVDLLNGQMQLL